MTSRRRGGRGAALGNVAPSPRWPDVEKGDPCAPLLEPQPSGEKAYLLPPVFTAAFLTTTARPCQQARAPSVGMGGTPVLFIRTDVGNRILFTHENEGIEGAK